MHPRDKQTASARFAAAALSILYGVPTPYLNPTLAHGATASTVGTTVTVTLPFTNVGARGLVITPKACPTDAGVPIDECSWLEVQLNDGVWRNATAAVAADGAHLLLTVSAPGTGYTVNATRGAFSPYPVAVLYSGDGLPALPWFAPIV